MSQEAENATTEHLFRRYQAGDREVFALIYHRHSGCVRVIVRRTLKLKRKDPSIDDVCQRVWLTVVRRAKSYRGEARFTTWLFGIMRIVCLKVLGEARRERERKAEFETHLRGNPPIVPGPSYVDLDRPAFRVALDGALAQVPPDQREAFELKYRHGLSDENLARILNVTPEAAKKRVQRCVARLRRARGALSA